MADPLPDEVISRVRRMLSDPTTHHTLGKPVQQPELVAMTVTDVESDLHRQLRIIESLIVISIEKIENVQVWLEINWADRRTQTTQSRLCVVYFALNILRKELSNYAQHTLTGLKAALDGARHFCEDVGGIVREVHRITRGKAPLASMTGLVIDLKKIISRTNIKFRKLNSYNGFDPATGTMIELTF